MLEHIYQAVTTGMRISRGEEDLARATVVLRARAAQDAKARRALQPSDMAAVADGGAAAPHTVSGPTAALVPTFLAAVPVRVRAEERGPGAVEPGATSPGESRPLPALPPPNATAAPNDDARMQYDRARAEVQRLAAERAEAKLRGDERKLGEYRELLRRT